MAAKYFRSALDDPEVTQVLCLVDITRLEKSLYFTLQVVRECERHGKQVLVLANMMDVLEKHDISVDLDGLATEMKAPVLPVSARTGKSFVPMLSGVACAIPGIYAARSIDSPKKRLLTYMAIPLMPCSARLPVYTLLIAAFIPNTTALGGLVGLQGLAMFITYFFGIVAGLLVTGLVSRIREDHFTDLPFVLEMPPYRIPAWQPLIRHSWNRSKHFVTKAGTIIFTVTVIVWILGYFPNYGADLGASWLGRLGQLIEPIFAPLGLDWRYGVAVMTSFLAREVFVGTLGAMFGIEGGEENMVPLVEQIQASGLPLGSGFALLVFFAIALMCVSTLAILSKEIGSNGLAVKLFCAYTAFAYFAAILTFQLVSWIAV